MIRAWMYAHAQIFLFRVGGRRDDIPCVQIYLVSKLPISYITQRKENLDNDERAHQMVASYTVLFESVSN